MRCLIVDDSERFLTAASDLLTREGVTVVGVAATGDDAAARVAELRPDVTLVDIDLGAESGFDVARRLADDHFTVVLISSHAEADFAELIEASPAAGFVAKSELSAAAVEAVLAAASIRPRGNG